MVWNGQRGLPDAHNDGDCRFLQAAPVLAGVRRVARRPYLDQLAQLSCGVRTAAVQKRLAKRTVYSVKNTADKGLAMLGRDRVKVLTGGPLSWRK